MLQLSVTRARAVFFRPRHIIDSPAQEWAKLCSSGAEKVLLQAPKCFGGRGAASHADASQEEIPYYRRKSLTRGVGHTRVHWHGALAAGRQGSKCAQSGDGAKGGRGGGAQSGPALPPQRPADRQGGEAGDPLPAGLRLPPSPGYVQSRPMLTLLCATQHGTVQSSHTPPSSTSTCPA